MALKKFNPKRIKGSFTGTVNGRPFAVPFTGYMDGEFVTAEYDEDAVTEHVGSDGEVTVVLNANKKATVTVVLTLGSESNQLLSVLVPDADLNYLPVGNLKFADLNGTSYIKGPEAWIRKTAPVSYSNQVTGRSWVFGVAKAEINVGASEAA